MRAGAVIGLIAGLLSAGLIWWQRGGGIPENPANPGPGDPSSRPAAAVTLPDLPFVAGDSLPPSTPEAAQGGSPLAAEIGAPGRTAADDVETVRRIIGQYTTALQRRAGPPIGDNRDLVRVLSGANPLRLAVLPPGHPAIDAEGRLLDRWGTPYHIHPLGAALISVRSAGPDRRLFTEDDLVTGE
jgi:hypothetical protein